MTAAGRRTLVVVAAVVVTVWAAAVAAQPDPPELTNPVNDFAGVLDAASRQQIDTISRRLEEASGDAIVVATIKTFEPWGDIRTYAAKMFENGGRGIGRKGRDNGLLVLLAVDDRRVWVEVGYDLEGFITDGFAGETSREVMTPYFRQGQYGAGLVAGVSTIAQRIAQARNVSLDGLPQPARRARRESGVPLIVWIILAIVIINFVMGAMGGRGSRRRRGRWDSHVGPFGGGYGGWSGGGGWGGGGGGFGGGFGGFGGGRSGGGGGGASW
jgi:uncharacterized protein